MISELEQLLKNNDISLELFYKETYNCFLVSILEVLIEECSDLDYKQTLLNRLRNSDNQILTIKNVINNRVRCMVNDDEANTILKWLKAFFNKKAERVIYDRYIKATILHQQNNMCEICNRKINIDNSELDHIIPFSMVGDELGIDNLQMLCSECNKRKSNNIIYNLKMFLVNNKD